jgi:hypothetical protein
MSNQKCHLRNATKAAAGRRAAMRVQLMPHFMQEVTLREEVWRHKLECQLLLWHMCGSALTSAMSASEGSNPGP